MNEHSLAINKLHEIFDAEISLFSTFVETEEFRTDLISLFLNTSSASVLSKDFIDLCLSKYNSDNDFRSLVDSVAAGMKFWFEVETDGSVDPFVSAALKAFSLNVSEVTGESSLTNPQLSAFRVNPSSNFNGVSFLSPVDFWLVCLMVIRATLYRSEYFKVETDKLKASRSSGKPTPTKRTTFSNSSEAKKA